jgi:hypothetical protein
MEVALGDTNDTRRREVTCTCLPPRWRLKERNKEMLRAAAIVSAWSWDARSETMLRSIDEEAEDPHRYMSAACDASMPRSVPGGRHDRCVYWWTSKIAEMRT